MAPQASRTGADALIWYLMASDMASHNPQAAAALLLQLDTYARPSEIICLQRCDVIRPVSRQCNFWEFIAGNSETGGLTKTRTQDDTVLLDSLDRDYAPRLLKQIALSGRTLPGPLFPDLI